MQSCVLEFYLHVINSVTKEASLRNYSSVNFFFFHLRNFLFFYAAPCDVVFESESFMLLLWVLEPDSSTSQAPKLTGARPQDHIITFRYTMIKY